jgi:hypothetical protein
MELKPVYSHDISARALNDQTVRVTLHLNGQQEKDFRLNETTAERVVKWMKRKGGDVDEHDVRMVLSMA